jgi:predicted acetyltransferase
LELQPDGRFAYPDLPLYWSEASRFPFLAVVDGAWAGFVLVRQIQGSTEYGPAWDMAEFFVLRGYRRRGIGSRLARLAFARFPGAWQVRVMEANVAADSFWRRAIESFTGATAEPIRAMANNMGWHVFRFESRP